MQARRCSVDPGAVRELGVETWAQALPAEDARAGEPPCLEVERLAS